MEKTKLAEKSDYEDCEVRRGTTRWVLIISSLVLLAFLVVTVIYGYHNFGLPDHPASRLHHSYKHDFIKFRYEKVHDRPPFAEKAKMARYIVHNSNWGVLTTFCTHNKGYPWGEVVSVTDGLENNSTGIPLIYISVLDVAAKDLDINPMASFTFSEAEGEWCRQHSVDPEDPRCTRVHLFGKIVKLNEKEIPAARKAMFTKHPVMTKWPKSHHFFFAKIELQKVEVLDFFGPLSDVSIDEYLKAKP